MELTLRNMCKDVVHPHAHICVCACVYSHQNVMKAQFPPLCLSKNIRILEFVASARNVPSGLNLQKCNILKTLSKCFDNN